MMFSIYTIISVLMATALAKGSIECNFLQCSGTCQCVGAAGQPLNFQLRNKEDTSLSLTKGDTSWILKSDKHGKIKFLDEHKYRYNNGTVKLGNATKRHSGNYTLEEHGSDGSLQRNVTVRLEILAPVSKPSMSQTCLSSEQMMVSCSSEGDGVESILTLDGQLLIQTRDHSQSMRNWTTDKPSVSSVTVNLHGQTTGNLMCQVNNNVSRDETVISLEVCKGTGVSAFVFVAVIAIAVTLFLFVALSLFLINRRKRPGPTPEPTPDSVDPSEDEIVYTHVKFKAIRKDD